MFIKTGFIDTSNKTEIQRIERFEATMTVFGVVMFLVVIIYLIDRFHLTKKKRKKK